MFYLNYQYLFILGNGLISDFHVILSKAKDLIIALPSLEETIV